MQKKNVISLMNAIYGENNYNLISDIKLPEYLQKVGFEEGVELQGGKYTDELANLIEKATGDGGFAENFYKGATNRVKSRIEDDKIHLCALYYRNNDDDIRLSCTFATIILLILEKLHAGISDDNVEVAYKAGDCCLEPLDILLDKVYDISKNTFTDILTSCGLSDDDISEITHDWFDFIHTIAKGAFTHIRRNPDALVKYEYKNWATYYFDRFEPESLPFRDAQNENLWVVSCNAMRFDNCINRLMRLRSINAPDVLIANECGMLFERMHFFLHRPIALTDQYKDTYGI